VKENPVIEGEQAICILLAVRVVEVPDINTVVCDNDIDNVLKYIRILKKCHFGKNNI
jgi:hypothetical protein